MNKMTFKLQLTVFFSCYYFQKLEQVYAVMLRKEEGAGLGFSIAGGSDLENKDPTVSNTNALQDSNLLIGTKPSQSIVFQRIPHN